MRSLPLTLALVALTSVPVAAAESFTLPSWMDIDFAEPIPSFDELDTITELPESACEGLVGVTAIPFESTPEELLVLAEALDGAGREAGSLAPAASAVSASLRAAAERGGDRQAMLGPWFDRAASSAIRELGFLAMSHCATPWDLLPMGPADRLIDLAEADHPDSTTLPDIASWSMSITGSPMTVIWNFGYLGDDPVALCDELSETLASAGFGGTELNVHDADLNDMAVGRVGEACRGA